MKLAFYGGSFNPPHLGHLEAARSVLKELSPDKLLIIPDNIPPHKELFPGSPTAEERMELCRLNFAELSGAEVSDMEINRQGKSYTAHTVERLLELYPEAELILTVGSDMFLSFEEWYRYDWLLSRCSLAVLSREEDDREELMAHKRRLEEKYSACVKLLSHEPLPMCSGDIRRLLRRRMGAGYLSEEVYAEIIRRGFYEAQAELSWLRARALPMLKPGRVAHVNGCEAEAVRLARIHGEDEDKAAEAAILHDITKKLSLEEQLLLCEKYGIICDGSLLSNPQLLHAVTGAALSRDLFGMPEDVTEAIRWHTTGKPDMTTLEKIIYLADYIEPNRSFPGLENVRELAERELDRAMALALEMSIEHIRQQNIVPHADSVEAWLWYKE